MSDQRLDPASSAAIDAALSGADPRAASDAVNAGNEPDSINKDNSQYSDAVDQSRIDLDEARAAAQEQMPQADEEQTETEAAFQDSDEGDEEESNELPDVEVVYVKGPNGRKQKLEIDYKDPAKIKKAYMGLAGMKKAYNERDQAINELKQYKEGEFAEKADNWNYLEQAFEKDGYRGVINAIEGNDSAFETVVGQYLEERRQWESMSDAERREFEARRLAEQKDLESNSLREEFEQFKQSVQQEKEQAELKSLETTVSSAFESYNFDGALGDPSKETMLNQMLWASGREKLAEYPDDVPLTADLARRVFRQQAKVLQEMIKVEGTKQAAKSVAKKKKQAAKTVQKTARKGQTSAGNDDAFNNAISRNDTKGMVKAWLKAQMGK